MNFTTKLGYTSVVGRQIPTTAKKSMKTIWISLIIFCFISKGYSQKQDYYWVLGLNASLQFNSIVPHDPQYKRGHFYVYASDNNSSICDKATGELLIYCHGGIIFNKLGLPMENGDSINNGKYVLQYYPNDVFAYQGSLILPYPNHNNLYYVFYSNLDSAILGSYLASKFRYSLVDISINNGLGKVVEKDKLIESSLFERGRINAILHANGRDWWIIINGYNDLQHYIYLLSPLGLKLYSKQSIGSTYNSVDQRQYQTCTNQSGNQIAYLYSTEDISLTQRVDLYDFDRCTGLLSNYKTITIIDTEFHGISFSPNDSLLYVNNQLKLYQFNIKDSTDTAKILIDRYNGTLDPFQVLFGMQKIAPDNKIYMGAWNGSRRLHCITQPNIRGKGCNFIQGYIHTDSSNHYFGDAMPNYPNFRLGVLKGSECDTIREAQPPTISDGLLIYPNPSNEWLMLNGKWLMGITNVVVYNMIGQKQLSFTFQNSKGFETINVLALANGMYVLQIIDAAGTKHNCKFVKQ